MKLMTPELLRQIPQLYSQEAKGDTAEVVTKFFTPWSNAKWYATEFDGEDTFFGFVTLGDPENAELGNFLLSELEATKGPFGFTIERDIYWKPRPLKEVMLAVESGGRAP
jgi:hypothetical protein